MEPVRSRGSVRRCICRRIRRLRRQVTSRRLTRAGCSRGWVAARTIARVLMRSARTACLRRRRILAVAVEARVLTVVGTVELTLIRGLRPSMGRHAAHEEGRQENERRNTGTSFHLAREGGSARLAAQMTCPEAVAISTRCDVDALRGLSSGPRLTPARARTRAARRRGNESGRARPVRIHGVEAQ